MNHEESRLRQNRKTGRTAAEATGTGQVKTFGSVEELIRHDAANTEVPPRVEERLKESLAADPPPKPAWWRRWLKPR